MNPNLVKPINAQHTLPQSLEIMEQMVLWLIRSGVGFNDFAAALKPIFFQQALQELGRINGKQTDSAISLLSGLHRRDVSALRLALETSQPLEHAKISRPVSVPARVVGRWLAEQLPNPLRFSTETTNNLPSFEALVRTVSNDRHPRSILQELIRLGLASEHGDEIFLEQQAFQPTTDLNETAQLMTDNLYAHLAAGVHNLTRPDLNQWLEQAVFADELTEASVQQLTQHSTQLWSDIALQLLQQANQLCTQDEGLPDARYCFRFGAYNFAQASLLPPTSDE